MDKTFQQLNSELPIIKRLIKCGLSVGMLFTKQELERFGIKVGDRVDISNAIPIKQANLKNLK